MVHEDCTEEQSGVVMGSYGYGGFSFTSDSEAMQVQIRGRLHPLYNVVCLPLPIPLVA